MPPKRYEYLKHETVKVKNRRRRACFADGKAKNAGRATVFTCGLVAANIALCSSRFKAFEIIGKQIVFGFKHQTRAPGGPRVQPWWFTGLSNNNLLGDNRCARKCRKSARFNFEFSS